MNNVRRGVRLFLLLSAGLLARPVGAQLRQATQVQVVSVVGESVFFGGGRAVGIAEGDVVLFSWPDGFHQTVTIRSISRNGARGTTDGTRQIEAGMTGIVAGDSQRRPPTGQNRADVATVTFQANDNTLGAVKRVHVRVTAASGGAIYIDKGRAAGIAPGDEVVFTPPQGVVNATVQSISRNSARCSILSGTTRIDVGTRGEVIVPNDRLSGSRDEPDQPNREVPSHPEWTRPPEDWDRSQPLLAPTTSRRPEEREREFHGRLFGQYLHTWNRHYGHNQYSLARVGASVWLENPFGRAGAIHIDGELNRRGANLFDDDDDVDGPGRLDRVSYRYGDSDEDSVRIELGRFLSYAMPEFGVVDGAEVDYRIAPGHQVGASLGFLPEPFPALVSGRDFQVGTFYRWTADEEETITTALGFQKTWHRGTPDRELLVGSMGYIPNSHWSLHGTIWGDFYDKRDHLKSSSFEVTEANMQPIFRLDDIRGVGAHISYVRWPQLLRREFSPFIERQVVSNRVFRYGVFAWHELGERMRVDGRADDWRDARFGSGTSWETRLSVRQMPWDNGDVSIAVFGTNGAYSSGPGLRASINRRGPRCSASLSYDIADYRIGEQLAGPSGGGPSNLVQQGVRTHFDFTLTPKRTVSVFTDYRFGNSQNAIQAGLFFQERL